jgi:hypothetical protein
MHPHQSAVPGPPKMAYYTTPARRLQATFRLVPEGFSGGGAEAATMLRRQGGRTRVV